MSKKILFIISSSTAAGGIEKYNANLIRHTADAGYEIKIVSRNDLPDRFRGVPSHSFGHINSLVIRKALFALASVWRALSFRPDLIICGHINFAPLCRIVSSISKTRYLILTHGIDVWDIRNNLKIESMRNADSVLTVSNFTKERILAQLPEVENRLGMLPNTVDGNVFSPAPKPLRLMKRFGITENNRIILTVARLKSTEENKGYYKVLDIMPTLLRDYPELVYIIAGDGDDLENIRNYVSERQIEDSVILTDYVPDLELPDFYNLSDIFIMPSKKEGFGIVFIEALSCGKPVICGNRDGSVDAVLNGELGSLVDPDDSEDIKLAIKDALSKLPLQTQNDAEMRRNRILNEFGESKFRQRLEECLEPLCTVNH